VWHQYLNKNKEEFYKKHRKKHREKLNSCLKLWLDREYINKKEFYHLKSSDSLFLPKAYGLPKVHKENLQFRVSVFSINTALHNIASFLHKIIADNIQRPDSHVFNSVELYGKLSRLEFASSDSIFFLRCSVSFY